MEGAGLEPDPAVPDSMGVNHVETPASFALLPMTLTVNSGPKLMRTKLTHILSVLFENGV